MGSIRRDPRNGKRWQARFRDPSGKQCTRSFARQADAAAFLASTEVDIRRGIWVDPMAGRVLMDEWIDTWWPSTLGLRPSTRDRDRGYIDRYIRPTFGTTPIGMITQPDVGAWVASLVERKHAAATVRKAYQLLAKILNSAVDASLLQRTPCRAIALPRVERREMRFLDASEIARLSNAIDPRYRALVLVAAYGGLRIGELAGLRRRRVDLLHGEVHVAETVVEVSGRLEYGSPKTAAGRRNVGLPKSVLAVLERHLAENCGPEGDAFVFPAPKGGALRVPAFRRRVWQPAVNRAGLTPLRLHDLRHSAVSLWIAAGANVKEVAGRAGHTSVSFTLDRYGHRYGDADLALRERLDDMMISAETHEPSNISSI